MMQKNVITRLFGRVFKLLLALITLLAAQMLLFMALIQMMRHNKRFRVKVFKLFNSVTLPLAGRRFSPYGLLKHTGCRSNQTYVTPLKVYPFGDGFVLTLTYGPDVDWCRNIMASRKCALTWKGQEYVWRNPKYFPSRRHGKPIRSPQGSSAGWRSETVLVGAPTEQSFRKGRIRKGQSGVTS